MKEHKRGTGAYRELKDKKKNLESKLKELRIIGIGVIYITILWEEVKI